MIKKVFAFGIITVLLSCSGAPQQASNGYFDLKSYFKKEAVRLNRYKTISKTVMVNGAQESKQVKILDWKKELGAFTDADVNKAAWKGAFKIEKTQERELYLSDNEKVQVKKLLIEKKNNKIFHINIVAKRSNMIYTSADTLDYYPDSLYSIRKVQHIKLRPAKEYTILGRFK